MDKRGTKLGTPYLNPLAGDAARANSSAAWRGRIPRFRTFTFMHVVVVCCAFNPSLCAGQTACAAYKFTACGAADVSLSPPILRPQLVRGQEQLGDLGDCVAGPSHLPLALPLVSKVASARGCTRENE